jgi:hypothetical protein
VAASLALPAGSMLASARDVSVGGVEADLVVER